MTLYKKGDEYLRIEVDSDPESPRDWDNLGEIATWHRRYILGDIQPCSSPTEYIARLEKLPGMFILPVYLYDHSGLTISTTPFSCPWDSGKLGVVCAYAKRIKELGVPLADVEERLRGEIQAYNQYLQGDVYGFTRFKIMTCKTCGHEEEEDIDSCWGFFGGDFKASGLLEAAGIESLDGWEEQ